jgi:hypothetical protein
VTAAAEATKTARARSAALALVAAVAVLTVLPAPAAAPGDRSAVQANAEPAHPLVFFDRVAFSQALAQVEASPPRPLEGARALVIPHHWLAGRLILGTLRDAAASGEFERVVLMGPNHTNAGGAPLTTSDLPWDTPFGAMRSDAAGIDELAARAAVATAPDVLTYEHSVAGIVPAVAYYLPDARVVPLVLGAAITADEISALVSALAALDDGRTLFVASVDFSHYLPLAQAHAMDAESVSALAAMDTRGILTYGNEHMDSPASIAVLMELARRAASAEFHLLENTDSTQITGMGAGSVTSYVAGYFSWPIDVFAPSSPVAGCGVGC